LAWKCKESVKMISSSGWSYETAATSMRIPRSWEMADFRNQRRHKASYLITNNKRIRITPDF
jgi:hypothetical protein